MTNNLRNYIHFIASFFRATLTSNARHKAYFKWISEKAEKRRYEFSHLNENSIVFDIGGYHGEFAEKMNEFFRCQVYVFEPVPEHYQICVDKFKNNPKIKVFPFGLSNRTESVKISNNLNASSINVTEADQVLEVQLKSVNDFISEKQITVIDVMKINIEGAEYSLLRSLIASDNVNKVLHLQIQFHDFTAEMRRQKPEIVSLLQKSHTCLYSYEFVWDGWQLRK